jgi:hypothetical protein
MSKKHSIFSRYVSHIRRSSKHIQQIHALFFAGGVTVLLASAILYFEYGFWRERYHSNEVTIEQKIEDGSKSPAEMFSQFISEVGSKMDTVKSGGNALLEGRESYSQREEFLFGTTTEEGQ